MPPNDLIIREAAFPGDAAGVAAVSVASATHHADLYPGSYHVPDADALLRYYRRMRPRPAASVILVAVQDDQIVAAADVRLLAAPHPASMLRPVPTALVEIGLLRQERSAAIRELLMSASEQWARQHGAGRLQIDVLADNRSVLDAYRKRNGLEVAGVVLTKDLDPDPSQKRRRSPTHRRTGSTAASLRP
jgi:GNAT superfamily N-acetyltransferase